MKSKEQSRNLRGKVVEKCNAGLGYEKKKKKSQALNISWSTDYLSSENAKSMAQLQTS